VAIAQPMCWSVISDAFATPNIVSSSLLDLLEEQSGDLWPLCNEYFSSLVTALFPEGYDFAASHHKYIKELTTCTGMKYNEVRNMTFV
jgi:hypothetical protein